MGTDDDDDVNILFVVNKAKSFVSNYKIPLMKIFVAKPKSIIWKAILSL